MISSINVFLQIFPLPFSVLSSFRFNKAQVDCILSLGSLTSLGHPNSLLSIARLLEGMIYIYRLFPIP